VIKENACHNTTVVLELSYCGRLLLEVVLVELDKLAVAPLDVKMAIVVVEGVRMFGLAKPIVDFAIVVVIGIVRGLVRIEGYKFEVDLIIALRLRCVEVVAGHDYYVAGGGTDDGSG